MLGKIELPKQITNNNLRNDNQFIDPMNHQETTKAVAFQNFETLKSDQYNKIYEHELAHQQAGGSLAGGISIEYDSNGVAIAGDVPITLPTNLTETNAQDAFKKATIALKSALAPQDPSSQDMSVASQAQGIINRAQNLISKPKHNKTEGTKLNLKG